MPVFNGEKTIEAALDSILGQSHPDFELIISDNASTDRTEEICRQYAKEDCRIHYIRQPQNIGAAKNFLYVLEQSQAQYFMWATSDDVKSVDFLANNYLFLIKNPDYVASTSPVRFEDSGFDSIKMGDASLIGDFPERIQEYFSCWHANGRFCSLMRTDVLKDNPYLREDFLGSDWAAMLYVISCGKTYRHSEGYVVLGRKGFSNSGNILKYYRTKPVHFVLPFYELGKAALKLSAGFPLRYKIRIILSLIKLNLQALRASARIEIQKLLAH